MAAGQESIRLKNMAHRVLILERRYAHCQCTQCACVYQLIKLGLLLYESYSMSCYSLYHAGAMENVRSMLSLIIQEFNLNQNDTPNDLMSPIMGELMTEATAKVRYRHNSVQCRTKQYTTLHYTTPHHTTLYHTTLHCTTPN